MRPQLTVIAVVLLALVLVYAQERYIGDARWWNLVMAGLLLAALAHYLWQDRASQR